MVRQRVREGVEKEEEDKGDGAGQILLLVLEVVLKNISGYQYWSP